MGLTRGLAIGTSNETAIDLTYSTIVCYLSLQNKNYGNKQEESY